MHILTELVECLVWYNFEFFFTEREKSATKEAMSILHKVPFFPFKQEALPVPLWIIMCLYVHEMLLTVILMISMLWRNWPKGFVYIVRLSFDVLSLEEGPFFFICLSLTGGKWQLNWVTDIYTNVFIKNFCWFCLW